MFFSRGVFVEYELGGKTHRVPLKKDPFTIGSSPDCELTLQHEMVADHHFLLVKNGDGWNLKLIGRNPVLINGLLLRDADRNLSNGDVFEISNVLAFTYRDPQEKTEISEESENTEAKPESRRSFYILFFSALISTTLLACFLVYLGKSNSGDAGANRGTRAIQAVIDDLPACIDSAAALIREGKVVQSVDPKGVYWQSAETVAAQGDAKNEIEGLKAAVRTALSEAMLFEKRADTERAKVAFSRVRDLVPDINCRANTLAAARMASLGGK